MIRLQQGIHLRLRGPLTHEQLAQVTVIQQAGHRAFDGRER